MAAPTRQTRSFLMAQLAEHGLHPRHDLGQNFLIDLNLLDYVVAQAALGPGDVALEVGAGTGSLTALLCAHAGHVVSVEYDARICELARKNIAGCANVSLLNQDVLRHKNQLAPEVVAAIDAALQGLARPPETIPADGPSAEHSPGAAPVDTPRREAPRLALVANLPYGVATPVISNLIALELPWDRMVVTIQFELAERMLARPGSEDYSVLTVWLQSQATVELLKKLRPEVFWPRPQVDSAIVRIVRRTDLQTRIVDRRFFHEMIRQAFTQRRKRLRGVLRKHFGDWLSDAALETSFERLGLSPDARAEALEPQTLVDLANALREQRPPTAAAPIEGGPN